MTTEAICFAKAPVVKCRWELWDSKWGQVRCRVGDYDSSSAFQELLELAFSIPHNSDEYLNFIAPDKHEVSINIQSQDSTKMYTCLLER